MVVKSVKRRQLEDDEKLKDQLFTVRKNDGKRPRPYETCVRDVSDEDDAPLPVKVAGRIMKSSKSLPKKRKKSEDAPLLTQDEVAASPNIVPEESVQGACERIAEITQQVVSNPEEHISQLASLRHYGQSRNQETVKLALTSQLFLFKDIIPGYRIREMEERAGVMLSKEVKRTRSFESTLLAEYQLYLKDLSTRLSGTMVPLRAVALECMCDLLVGVPHFNFRINIMKALVLRLDSKNMSNKIIDTFGQLFEQDVLGDVSLEAVQLIQRHIKGKDFDVKPAIIRLFLRLSTLNEMEAPKQDDPETKKAKKVQNKREKELPKKKRSQLKEDRGLERDMQESEGVHRKELKAKFQSQILEHIFSVYVRVLKGGSTTALLPAVIEGLRKYARLINVDFFPDLFQTIKKTIKRDDVSSETLLNGVFFASRMLFEHGDGLSIDLKEFFGLLYKFILSLPQQQHLALLTIQVLQSMFFDHKQLSTIRLAAFLKRLCTVALHVQPHVTLAILAFCKKLMSAYAICERLLDSERIDGVYLPEVEDPELSNAFCTNLWELALFENHFHPAVRDAARAFCTGSKHDSGTQATELLAKYDFQLSGTFIPDIKPPRQ